MEFRFGGFVLKVRYFGGEVEQAVDGRVIRKQPKGAQVSMFDLGQLRFPMVWSKTMTLEQAQGAIDLFNLIGYFEMPIG